MLLLHCNAIGGAGARTDVARRIFQLSESVRVCCVVRRAHTVPFMKSIIMFCVLWGIFNDYYFDFLLLALL